MSLYNNYTKFGHDIKSDNKSWLLSLYKQQQLILISKLYELSIFTLYIKLFN